MISRVLAAELGRHVGDRVRIAGWVHRRRELKSVTFVIVRDRSGVAQVVVAGSDTGGSDTGRFGSIGGSGTGGSGTDDFGTSDFGIGGSGAGCSGTGRFGSIGGSGIDDFGTGGSGAGGFGTGGFGTGGFGIGGFGTGGFGIGGLGEETVVGVVGTVVANGQAPGGYELTDPEFTALSEPAVVPPFDLYRPTVSATLPTVLDNAAVALRHPALRRRFAVAAAGVAGFRSTLDRLGFVETHTPKIVSSATESGANVFGIDYFGRRAYLAQSPQFFKQALVGVFERVYEVGPVFRAEPHDTARHLAQYTSLDAELGFVADHTDVMAVLREAVAGMVDAVAHLVPDDVPVVPEEIPAIHFSDAQELLAQETGEDPRGEPDLAPAHERALSDWAVRTHGSEFLFVTGYPMAKRPFYTHPDPARPGYSNSFDLLFRGLELVTGGQRLHRHGDYLAALRDRGADPEPYRDYLDVFAHGMPPHGGFALGLERWTARLLGLGNVRWTTLFPRDLHRLTP